MAEEGRIHHMRIHQNLTNQLNFDLKKKKILGSSSIMLRSFTNGLGNKKTKKEERIYFFKSSATNIFTNVIKVLAVMDQFFLNHDRYIVNNVTVTPVFLNHDCHNLNPSSIGPNSFRTEPIF